MKDIQRDELGSLAKRNKALKSQFQDVFTSKQAGKLNKKMFSDTSQTEIITDVEIHSGPDNDEESLLINDPVTEETPNYAEVTTANILPAGCTRRALAISIAKTTSPPKGYSEIKTRNDKDKWYEAYNKELTSLNTIGNMKVVPRPKNAPVIPLLELFTVKYDNVLSEYIGKCRFVARGDLAPKYGNYYVPIIGAQYQVSNSSQTVGCEYGVLIWPPGGAHLSGISPWAPRESW